MISYLTTHKLSTWRKTSLQQNVWRLQSLCCLTPKLSTSTKLFHSLTAIKHQRMDEIKIFLLFFALHSKRALGWHELSKFLYKTLRIHGCFFCDAQLNIFTATQKGTQKRLKPKGHNVRIFSIQQMNSISWVHSSVSPAVCFFLSTFTCAICLPSFWICFFVWQRSTKYYNHLSTNIIVRVSEAQLIRLILNV